jgi:hypothetical protein
MPVIQQILEQMPPQILDVGEGDYAVTVSCPRCKKPQNLRLPIDGLRAYNNGALIQVAFPNLSVAFREMLLTGWCDDCWNEIFLEED